MVLVIVLEKNETGLSCSVFVNCTRRVAAAFRGPNRADAPLRNVKTRPYSSDCSDPPVRLFEDDRWLSSVFSTAGRANRYESFFQGLQSIIR